jgi:hypothetical protein
MKKKTKIKCKVEQEFSSQIIQPHYKSLNLVFIGKQNAKWAFPKWAKGKAKPS